MSNYRIVKIVGKPGHGEQEAGDFWTRQSAKLEAKRRWRLDGVHRIVTDTADHRIAYRTDKEPIDARIA